MNKTQHNLIIDNIEFCNRIVFKYYLRVPQHQNKDDFLSEGYLGLCEAALKFDSSQNVPFQCFARIKIQGRLFDFSRRSCKHYFEDSFFEKEYLHIEDNFILDSLEGLGKEIVFDYYWNQKSMNEISVERNLSKTRIHQIIKENLKKLKKCENLSA